MLLHCFLPPTHPPTTHQEPLYNSGNPQIGQVAHLSTGSGVAIAVISVPTSILLLASIAAVIVIAILCSRYRRGRSAMNHISFRERDHMMCPLTESTDGMKGAESTVGRGTEERENGWSGLQLSGEKVVATPQTESTTDSGNEQKVPEAVNMIAILTDGAAEKENGPETLEEDSVEGAEMVSCDPAEMMSCDPAEMMSCDPTESRDTEVMGSTVEP